MEERERQPTKVQSAIYVSEFGRLMFSRAEQFSNDVIPMDVIEPGKLIFLRAEQPWNDLTPMYFIDFGMITVFNESKGVNTPFPYNSPSAI